VDSQRADRRAWLNFCHLLNLNWELPKLVAIKGLIMGVSVPSRSATRGSWPSVSRSETPRFPPFFDISRRGHLQSNLWQSPQSSSILSSSRSVSCAHMRWKSRPPECLCPLGSPARVRTTITFFGECDTARLLARLDGIFTVTFLHYTERDDYIDQAPCRFRVLPALPLGMPI